MIQRWIRLYHFHQQQQVHQQNQLLRHFQSRWHQPPRYKEVEVVGPPHDRIFTMGVLDINGGIVATYTARNKKVAEQEASRLALEILEKQDYAATD